MALDIVKLYISLISDFFKLSDMAVMASPNSNTSTALLPVDSHSLVTAHYLLKVIGELQESVSELHGMEISGEASLSLNSLVESAKWSFTDILVNAWLRGKLLFLPLSPKLKYKRCPHILLP